MASNRRKRKSVAEKGPSVPEATTKVVEEPITKVGDTITNAEEAKELIEQEYRKPLTLEYIVLANKQVFYGINRKLAYKTAEKNKVKCFDVNFKT